MKKLLYIYNPTAGRKTAKMNLSDALEVFTRQGYEISPGSLVTVFMPGMKESPVKSAFPTIHVRELGLCPGVGIAKADRLLSTGIILLLSVQYTLSG